MYLLVAKDASPNDASFWVASIDEPVAPLTLRVDNRQIVVPALSDPWKKPGTFTLRTGRVDVPGLAPRTRYPAQLERAGAVVAEGAVRTPPATMPATGDSALRVLLGSCFCRLQDKGGLVNSRF